MKISEIRNAVSSLAGVGPATATLLANLNIFTVSDLLQYYPRDYEDRTRRISFADAYRQNVKAHTIAQVVAHDWFGYGRMKTLKLIVTDGTLQTELVAFNRAFLEKSFPVGSIIAVTGKFEEKYGRIQCTGFDAEKIADGGTVDDFAHQPVPNSAVFPRYHLTEGLSQKMLAKVVGTALAKYALGIENELPDELIAQHRLLPKAQAIRQIHQPKTMQEAADARKSLVYEELFLFQKTLAARALAHRGTLPALDPHKISQPAQPPVSPDDFAKDLSPRQKQLLASLPFPLTDDQRSVIVLMNDDIDKNYAASQKNTRPFAMRTLLQGDVGSGKTLAAFFVCLRIIDYGSQCAFMAPTEILARQHAENAARQLESLHVRVAYLTGNVTSAGRRQLLDALKSGEIDLVIGTHALFSKQVQYHDLALAVIDEQHRFGVMQRSAIIVKGRTSTDALLREPNLLMMSATPIPQTLALTVFGDLDVRSIHTMPGGRKQIQTYLVRQGNERNAYEAVRKELQAGHQAYFVYPAIEKQFFDSDESGAQKTALKSAEENFAFLSRQVYPEYTVALIHGNIDEDTQNRILTDFRAGNIQILVATSVVEVGVDVPNATCMVIEQADRFGLAALHQLRGRVGRGNAQSFCFLIYSAKLTETGIARMKILRESTDGFAIAEEDLRLRGPGEITGTAQSGELTFAIADPVRDKDIMLQARADAFRYAT